MKKGLVISILAMLALTLFSVNVTQAVDPNISIQPRLIQDDQMKPLDPPLESHPTAHQYTAPVTNPGNAYDNNQMTYSRANVTQQPYPSLYCRPTANSGNATVTTPGNAYDLDLNSFASIDVRQVTPSLTQFSVQTFNITTLTSVSSVDIKMKYNLTIDSAGSNCSYKIILYVGAKNITLQSRVWTTTSVTTVQRTWIAVTEPNDGVWNRTDVGNIRISFLTQRSKSADRATFRVFEVWAPVYPPNVRYFDLRTFSPTGISSLSYLNVKMNYTAIIGKSSYRILVSVGSANTTVQNWVDVSQVNPVVVTWEHVAEPNDGWWNQTDLSNMRMIIETQKIESAFNNGEICVYEAWVTIDLPTVNSYPSTHSGTATVTNPTRAYDKNQMTYASITSTLSTSSRYFAVQSFNATTLDEYATINLQMRYNATTRGGKYRVYIQVGTKTLDLIPDTNTNQTAPTLMTWKGVCEPNDAVWTPTDLSNLQVRVQVRNTTATGTCTFREYETWLTVPKDSFTVRVNVSGVLSSAPLYAWQLNLTFNPTVLQAVMVSEGPFLKQAGVTNFAGYTISNTGGWVFSGCAVDDWFGGGVYGSGALTTVTFQTIAKGNSMFNFTETLLRSFDEINEIPVPIPHTRSPGWFQYLVGDVNGDSKVNATDLYQLGRAYGSTSGNPAYNVNADQDKDGDVDGADLTTVSNNYGAT